uniref:Uncharacterized protein n=1 Tax=Oryza barthii TaxID=65489 RepID=A0A0D3ERV2_9ORYZ
MGVVGLAENYHACVGGGGSVLEVSYHGMAVAMGRVPRFCVHGKRAGGERADGVASAEATSVREELRGLIRSERQIVGAAEFSVEGKIKGFGYLRCKALWFRDDKRRSPIPLCQVEA